MSPIQLAHCITIRYYFLPIVKCSRVGGMFPRYATRKASLVNYVREAFCFPETYTPVHFPPQF